LEFWFEKLTPDWSEAFTINQLEEGRRIYRSGEVRELELGQSDAIVHRRNDKRDEYAVIEWTSAGIAVRSSSSDRERARALAVAGLHEIEELVADELPPLPGEFGPNDGFSQGRDGSPADALRAPASGRPGNFKGGAETADGEAARPYRRPGDARGTDALRSGPTRPLQLVFRVKAAGLAFQAFWLERDRKGRVPALGANAQSSGNGHVSSGERAKLIGLAAYARRAHFHYDQETGVYLLGSLTEIPNFLRTVLPVWRRIFPVEIDERAGHLLQGTRAVEVEAVAERARGRGSPAGTGARMPEAHRIPSKRRPSAEGQGMALNLRWIFRSGERMLNEGEVAALLKRGGEPVILPNIGIVSLAPERWDSYCTWQRSAAEAAAAEALPPYLIFSLFNDSRLKVTLSAEIEEWRRRVLAAPENPPELAAWLRPYQRRGVEWLRHLCEVGCHGLLADEMGLGKTAQALSLLATRPLAGRPSLVVCPASVVPVWKEEIAKFYPHLPVEILKAGHDFSARGEPALWLASYTQLRKHRHLLDAVEFGYAVLDEGQFIKNPDAKVTQTCFAVRARHRIVLTGTPLENRQLDLWSIFRFLLPGLLGSRAAFESALHADRDGTVARLRAQLAPFILRRTKKDVAQELPPKVEMDLICPLTDVQRSEYARICAEGLARLGDDVGAAMREKSFGFLALLTRLRQTCCDPDMLPWLHAPLSDSGKITLLLEKLSEVVGSGHKAVIFSQFVVLLGRVRSALIQQFPELPRYELTGMTLDRQKPVQEFQNAAGAAAMLVSLKAAGTGITLHAADYVFLMDPWWNPAVEAQAVDRVHRIGQTNTVFVYRMVTAGTIEERIQALKESKKDLFDKLVGGLGGDFDLSRHFTSLQSLVQLTGEPAESEQPQ
jgi:superfamily II DNA or RNA helicase